MAGFVSAFFSRRNPWRLAVIVIFLFHPVVVGSTERNNAFVWCRNYVYIYIICNKFV